MAFLRGCLAGLMVACAVVSAAQAQSEMPVLSSYANEASLQDDSLRFFWTVNDSDSTLHMALHGRTSGWLALGFAEVGAMIGSDVILGWVGDGQAVVTDRFIFNKSADASGVALDASQDVTVVAGLEAYNQSTGDVWTTLHFRRALDTGDCNDRAIRKGDPVPIVWAMGTTDTASYHGLTRGGASLVLWPGALFSIYGPPSDGTTTSSTAQAALVQGTQHRKALARRGQQQQQQRLRSPIQGEGWLNFTAPTYNVPSNYTTYACNAFDIPYSTKQHMIEWGVIVNSTHPESLHHAVLYACQSSEVPSPDPNYDCLEYVGCAATLSVWALGGKAVTLPAQAGMPLGRGGFTKLVLQIHYTNPGGLNDIVDQSGMYYKISPTLRKHDAGVLPVGPFAYWVLINVPPHQPAWTQDSVCPSQCTKRILGSSNVTVFNSLLHQHSVGKQVYTDLYRGGKKLFTVNRQDYYDFGYQQFRGLGDGFYLMPGDELKTRCVWDTSNKTELVPGGSASDEEMCMNYLLYYPVTKTSDFKGVGCFNFCADLSNNTLDRNVTAPHLKPYATCGDYTIPLPGNCSIEYGSAQPFEAISGCSNSTALSLSQVSSPAVSIPAVPGPTGPPSLACSTTDPSGLLESYTNCSALDGGFSLMWNHSDPSSGPNTTLSLFFSGSSFGYIAFGFSPDGKMMGSSVVAGWVGSSGPVVRQLYLGGYAPDLISPEGTFQIQNPTVQTLLGSSGTTTIQIRAQISIPSSQATVAQPIVWSKGQLFNDFVSQHAATDAHTGTLVALSSSSAPAPTPPKPSAKITVSFTPVVLVLLLATRALL